MNEAETAYVEELKGQLELSKKELISRDQLLADRTKRNADYCGRGVSIYGGVNCASDEVCPTHSCLSKVRMARRRIVFGVSDPLNQHGPLILHPSELRKPA